MIEQGDVANAGTNLDPWYAHYAERTAGLSASEVRALFAVASRARGGLARRRHAVRLARCPTELVTVARWTASMREQGPIALQYGSGQGDAALREQILEVMALEGIRAGVDDVVVTTGSQHALELVTKLFLDPGDVVLAEGPSYVRALVVFRVVPGRGRHVADG